LLWAGKENETLYYGLRKWQISQGTRKVVNGTRALKVGKAGRYFPG